MPEISAETCVRDEPRNYSRTPNIYRDTIRCEAILGYFDESDIDIIGVKGIPKKSQTAPVGAFSSLRAHHCAAQKNRWKDPQS